VARSRRDGRRHGVLFERTDVDSLARRSIGSPGCASTVKRLRRHAERFSRERHMQQMRAVIDEPSPHCREQMVRRYNRLFVAFYVITDALLAMVGVPPRVRHPFESGLIP